MNESRAIVINGLSRGGTNILWNLLQSHPQVCSPIHETGELIFDHIAPFTLFDPSTAKRLAARPIVSWLGRSYLRRQFNNWKLRTLDSPDNNTRYEGVPYNRKEVEDSMICFKGVDSDVDLNGLLESLYDDVAHVVLVRNGYAVCNGWKRRGVSPRDAGRKYSSLLRRMLAANNGTRTFILVRFEEMVGDPFGTSRRLFEELHLEPTELPKLRLKSKPILSESGTRSAAFGQEGRKYWFGPEEVSAVLDTGIDARQMAQLKDDARREFELQAKGLMQELGYIDQS